MEGRATDADEKERKKAGDPNGESRREGPLKRKRGQAEKGTASVARESNTEKRVLSTAEKAWLLLPSHTRLVSPH